MLRSLLSLLLVASLLSGALMPCCLPAGDAELPDAAAAEAGGCGHGKPAQQADEASMDCDDCSHCLQPASPLRSFSAMTALAPDAAVAVPDATAPPLAPRAPPLRPPIRDFA
jgi:hypothetical protein